MKHCKIGSLHFCLSHLKILQLLYRPSFFAKSDHTGHNQEEQLKETVAARNGKPVANLINILWS